MVKDFFSVLYDMWLYAFFFTPLQLSIALFSLYKLVSFKTKLTFRAQFIVYISAVLLDVVLVDALYFLHLPNIKYLRYCEVINCCYALLELLVFFSFFRHLSSSAFFKKLLKFLVIVLVVGFTITTISLFSLASTTAIAKRGEMVSVIGLSIIVFLCLRYFWETYKMNEPIGYKESLIVLALLFYCLISIPFFSVAINLHKYYPLVNRLFYAVHYLSLSLVCLSIAYYASQKSTSLILNK